MIPEFFEFFKDNKPLRIDVSKLPEDLKNLFVADGNPKKIVICRSPWHDYREKQSKGNKRDFFCNIWATPLGSSDAVFDATILYEIKDKFIREPNFKGEVIISDEPRFIPNYKQQRLKWWGNLINGRPDQRHNYIVGCDPSYGLGSSNSAAEIYDVNTKELVGEWVCSNTKPEDFADQVVALAKWCGGIDPTLLIWENNGGHGVNFTNRVIWNGYYHCYTQTVEDSKTRKRQKKYGWHSTADKKAALFGEFGIALAYGLENNSSYKSCKIYNEDLLDELFDYVFKEGTKEIVTSSKSDLSSGARERHGDRAVAAGLCILGTRDQKEGDFKTAIYPPERSFQARYNRWLEQEEKKKQYERRYLY